MALGLLVADLSALVLLGQHDVGVGFVTDIAIDFIDEAVSALDGDVVAAPVELFRPHVLAVWLANPDELADCRCEKFAVHGAAPCAANFTLALVGQADGC